MAVLSDPDRADLHTRIMADLSADHESCAVTKADLRAALNAADDWANANAASFNSALPVPARTALTAQQKARLLMAVLRRRWEVA
jgi:hypothetical protein